MILLLFVLLLNNYLVTSEEKIKVSLYYETLCPFSQEFITKSFSPGYQKLGNSIDLVLVPFGNAKERKTKSKWRFTCQHGPEECYGNKLQACVIDLNLDQSKTVNFVNCIMQEDGLSKARQCIENIGASWNKIKSCVRTDKGKELLAKMGNITLSLQPRLEYVPQIRYNDVYNETIDQDARDDFLGITCSMFKDKPEGCPGMNIVI